VGIENNGHPVAVAREISDAGGYITNIINAIILDIIDSEHEIMTFGLDFLVSNFIIISSVKIPHLP
jgi:hypothetical protein